MIKNVHTQSKSAVPKTQSRAHATKVTGSTSCHQSRCSQNTEEDPLMAAATKYAAAQIESEVDGKCCPMQKQSSAQIKKKAI